MSCYNLKIMIFTLFVLLGHNAFCQTPQVEITSYDVKVNLDLPNNQLHVTGRLGLHKADTINEFEMLLNSEAKIDSIKSKMNDGWIDMAYKFAGKDTLHLTVPSGLVSDRELTIDFEYTLSTGKIEDKLTLYRGHRWYPLILDNIAKFKLTATVPSEYVVFSAGDLVGKNMLPEYSEFFWESKIPVFKIPLIIAKSHLYKETVKELDSKEIYFYSSTIDDKEVEERIISEVGSIFKFYSELIGEYPHNRLTLIEIPELQGTNIATGLLMVGSPFIDAFKKGYYESLHLSIACQWFAAGVFFKLFGKGFWFLQLSLPHYLRLMYLEQTKGEDAFIKGLQSGLDAYKKIVGTENEVPILDVDFPNTKEKSRVIYGKGPYVIDKVRKQIGDENWGKLIKDIYKDFKGRIFSYDEFKKYLSGYDKDSSCILRLEKWLTETGVPEDKSN